MKEQGTIGDTIWWALRAALTIVIGLLLLRALVEFVPALNALPPVRSLLRYWDPVMTDALLRVGVPWTHDVRGVGSLATGVALILLRTIFDDFVTSLMRPRPARGVKLPAAVEEALAADAPADTARARGVAAPAPAARAPEDMAPKAQAPASVTGTSFNPAFGAAGAKAPAAPLVQRIGRYDIVEELGRGAMGVVYMGMDPTIGRTVAIKTVSAIGSGPEVEQYRERFLIEARSAGRLNHPGIVSVYDVTEDDAGRPSLVLEFIAGTPLDKIIAESSMSMAQTLDVLSQVARALDYAHSNGVIHRDVKPANIMVTADGVAKLGDFGIAKMDGTGLTMAGLVLGTPAFMSPEQCTGAALDRRSDIFSLGAVIYTACTRQRPFPGDTFTSVAYNVVHEGPEFPSKVNPRVPEDLGKVIMRCMAKDPAERYQAAGEVAVELDKARLQYVTQDASQSP